MRITLIIDPAGTPGYVASVDGVDITGVCPLGIVLDDADFSTGLTITDRGRRQRISYDYPLAQGKVARVRGVATQREVALASASGRTMTVALWASAQGVAVRYRFADPRDGATHTVTRDLTGITARIPADGGAQFTEPYTPASPKYQDFYLDRNHHGIPTLGSTVTSALTASGGATFPILLRSAAADGTQYWLLASESGALGSYPACHLKQPVRDPSARTATFAVAFPTDDEALGTFGPGAPRVSGAWDSPWRFIAIARDAATVAETTLATDLAEPNAIGDFSWVTPGSASFSWLTDNSSPTSLEKLITWLDLSKKLGWPYSLIDVKWDQMTDATGASVPLERLALEAKLRGVRLFLWYNSAGTNNDASGNTPRDKLADPATRLATFARLAALGIAGVKVDGWQSDKQQLLALQRDLLIDAAKFKLHVVLHNTTIPRGWDRTYPHLLGVEAGIASEYYNNTKPYTDQMAEQNTISAVVRNAVGPFDYGTTLFTSALKPGADRYTSAAHELALAVIFQSGFNGFADAPDKYLGQDEQVRTALSSVPCDWDETRFLTVDPARQVIVARRKGRVWWVAGINGVTTSISPGLSTSAPGYRRASGASLPLAADLRALKIGRGARATLFRDVSSTDSSLVHEEVRGNRFTIDTAPFGGFLLVFDGGLSRRPGGSGIFGSS
ncbi:glycoside hydrolase family 97 catalytic domain-containing protein [Williamsia sp. CHRR-6]|nr:glycoside hydrolase family 97 catalytic domain-containing protein [Williamsia sp. CHRR-6]